VFIVKTGVFKRRVALISLLACGSVLAADDELRSFTEEGRRLATQIVSQVRGELVKRVGRESSEILEKIA